MPASSSRHRPEARREATASGHDTLVVDGRFFHSRYDPRKEAARAAAEARGAALVFLLSPGLGYLADELRNARVVAIERHPEIAALSSCKPLVDPSPEDIYQLAFGIEDLRTGRVAILAGACLEEDADWYGEIRAAILRAIDKRAEEAITVRGFAALWSANLAANAALVRRSRWITDLDGTLAGRTAVILAAGPSLEPDLPVLAAHQKTSRPQPVVIAVDSALPMARALGVRVDLCVSIDPQPVKAVALAGLGETPLVASVLSPPAILAAARHLYLFGQNHPDESSLPVPPAAVLAEPGGSVATAAVVLAVRWQAAALVLVGQDLAFLDGRMHCREAPSFSQALAALHRFSALEQTWARPVPGKPRWITSNDGGRLPTTPALDSYRLFLEKLAQTSPHVKCFTTSLRGARIEGFSAISLADCLQGIAGPADDE